MTSSEQNRQSGCFPGSTAAVIIMRLIHRFTGEPLDERGVWKRSVQTPIQKARLGAEAIEWAQETGDTDLLGLGQATVASSIADAEDMPADHPVQVEVVQVVTEIASTVPLENLMENPRVSSEVAETVIAVLRESKDES
jgi:hypothetical protein